MPEILQPVQLAVERDGSGGIKLRLGSQMAQMSPEQAFEFAMIVLDRIGVETNIGANVQPHVAQRHFRPG